MIGRPADPLEDAILVTFAAVRQKAKNELLLRALRDGADYSASWHRSVVRDEFTSLAHQALADARRLTTMLFFTRYRRGIAKHAGDYRSGDRTALKRRRELLRRLAAALKQQSMDETLLASIAAEATTTALAEIADAAASSATHLPPGKKLSPEEHEQALAELVAELSAERRRLERHAQPVHPSSTREGSST